MVKKRVKSSVMLSFFLSGPLALSAQYFDTTIDTLDVALVESRTTTYEITDRNTVWAFDSVKGIEYPRYTTMFEPYDPWREKTPLGILRIIEPMTQTTVLEMETAGFGGFSETGMYFTIYDSLASTGGFEKPGTNYFVTRIYNIQGQLMSQRMPDTNHDPEFYISSVGGLIESIPGYWEAGEFASWYGIRDFNHNLIWQLHAKDFLGADAEPGWGGFEWRIIELPTRDQFILFCKNKGIYGIDLFTGATNWSVPVNTGGIKVSKDGLFFYFLDWDTKTRDLYTAQGQFIAHANIYGLGNGFEIRGDSLLISDSKLYRMSDFNITQFTNPLIERGGTFIELSQNGKFLIREGWGGEGVYQDLLSVTMKSGKELPYIPVNFLNSAIPQKLQISNDGNHIYFMVPSEDVTPQHDRFVHINLEGVPGWDAY